ncbi:MAG TPA: ECF transporter S component [Firmicutes bacterium]|nr:ECF transporter S component [Candidatus Fermentithermobacillaceae bacterium]
MRSRALFSTRQIAFAGVLGAVTVVLGSTPMGFIQIPPISITIMHIPTIIAGVLQGPVIGGIVGAMFGAFSMYQAQTSVNPLEKAIFSNPLIAVLPRVLIGVVAHYVFHMLKGRTGKTVLVLVSSGLVGYTGYALVPAATARLGLWSTFGNPVETSPIRIVLALALALLAGFIVHRTEERLGHGPALAAAAGSLTNTALVLGLIVAFGFMPAELALAVGVMNGIPEAVVAIILTGLVYRAVARYVEG